MRKRTGAKPNSKLLVSPLPLASPSEPYEFKINRLSSSKKKTLPSSPLLQPQNPRSPKNTLGTISDLKDLASSRVDSIKRHLDLFHSGILKEIEASGSRLSKRFKIHSQACLHVTEEAEKEYKKMSDRITENMEVMKASYAEFIAEAQATTSRVCKIAIPELTQSLEKGIESLRSQYGVSLTKV